MEKKPLVDELGDLFEGDVIRGILALMLVIATVVMAFKNLLNESFLVLTTAVITFYFGTKNGIHQERVSQMLNCPLVVETATGETEDTEVEI